MITTELEKVQSFLISRIDGDSHLELHCNSKEAAWVFEMLEAIIPSIWTLENSIVPEHLKQPEAIERENIVVLDHFRRRKQVKIASGDDSPHAS